MFAELIWANSFFGTFGVILVEALYHFIGFWFSLVAGVCGLERSGKESQHQGGLFCNSNSIPVQMVRTVWPEPERVYKKGIVRRSAGQVPRLRKRNQRNSPADRVIVKS